MTIQLFHSILTLTNFLNYNIYKKNVFNNFVINNNNYKTILNNNIEYHNLKCWKSYCIFNNYMNNLNDNNMIYSLDFHVNKNDINNPFIKIDYLYVNNDFYDIKYNEFFKNRNKLLKEDETKLIIKSLINFIEKLGKKEQIKKIIIDIHKNLERYEYELKDLGFIINDNDNNHFWIQAEKII
jgi:hypothetical protein